MTQTNPAKTDCPVYFKSATAMAEVESSAVDLVVTSPPYYTVKDYSRNGRQTEVHSAPHPEDCGAIENYPDYLAALLAVWRECSRVLKPNGKLCINAPLMPLPKKEYPASHNRRILNLYADIERSILENLPEFSLMDLYIWNRANPTKRLMFGSYPYPRNLYAQNTAEFIGVFVKEGPPAPIDPEAKAASALTQEEWREYTRQVWTLPVPNQGDPAWGKHPAIMPEEIARRCIRMFSCAGDLVLDPFAGSGTTLKAARELGRRAVGYEIYENYQPVITTKIAQANRIAAGVSRINQ